LILAGLQFLYLSAFHFPLVNVNFYTKIIYLHGSMIRVLLSQVAQRSTGYFLDFHILSWSMPLRFFTFILLKLAGNPSYPWIL
jgi:hypothetical protein